MRGESMKFLNEIRDRITREPNLKKLLKKGLKVGKGFSMQRGCLIDPSHCFLIQIGDFVTLAPRVHILAHDASTKRDLGYTKIGLVEIGNNVFVGANTTILPNVKIGDNVIIGANSLVSKDIPQNSVVAGNPAVVVASKEEFLEKNKAKMNEKNVWDSTWTERENITEKQKQKMKEILKDGIGFVE